MAAEKKQKVYDPDKLLGVEKKFEYLKVKGKYYEFSARDGKTVLIEVPKKKVDEQLKMAKELAKKLKADLDTEKVLTEIFMTKYDKKNLDKLYKLVFKSKQKYKPITRDAHCVDMKIGNHIIPIVE